MREYHSGLSSWLKGSLAGVLVTWSGGAPMEASPFWVAEVPAKTTPVMASGPEGMCGGEGRCGGMMEGILPPGPKPEQLPQPGSPGAKALTRYCGQCHNLPSPSLRSPEEWPAIVDRMNHRMQIMEGRCGMGGGEMQAPSDEELAELLAYLRRHGMQTLEEDKVASLESPGGKAFREACSRCHQLPDPAQHSSEEWPGIVRRMVGNMAAMEKEVPDEQTLRRIVEFLQKRSGEK